MSLEGMIFEHRAADGDLDLCCSMRVPLSERGYVNFRYPAGASVRHGVAITSIVAILQRSRPSENQQFDPSRHSEAGGRRGRSIRIAESLEGVR